MTPDQINDAIDAMAAAAGGDPDKLPGLITVRTDDWVGSLRDFRATCKALSDGMRHRDIVIHVASNLRTAVLTRAEAGERGQPFRDLPPRL